MLELGFGFHRSFLCILAEAISFTSHCTFRSYLYVWVCNKRFTFFYNRFVILYPIFASGVISRSFYDELLAASPHSFPPRNINERQALFQTTSPVEVTYLEGRKATLSEGLVEALKCFSDELNLNETTSLSIWALVSSKENRDALSDQFGCELGQDVPLAARRLFLLDRSCLLLCIRDIVQASLDTNLPQETSRDFKKVLNNLLKSGLVSNLLKTVKEVTQLGTNASSSSQYGGTYQQSSSIPSTTMAFLDVQRLRAAECCFYMFYRMQVTAEEVLALASTCQLVSGQLANELSGESPLHGHGGTLGNNSHHLESRWGIHEVSLLQTSQVLLMALACALDRNHILMDRMTQQPNMFGVGNGLWKRGGPMAPELLPVQHLIMESKWEHSPSQGIAAFIWANFVAPSAALNPQDAAAVKSALEFVLRCRTFSFLRSCVLGPSRYRWLRDPVRKDGGGAQELCLSVLADLVLGYLRFTCSEGGAGEGLPVSKLRYLQELEFNMRHFTNQQQAQQQPQVSVALGSSNTTTEDIDCLDDVLLLVSDACEAFPDLATTLWGTASSANESGGNVPLSGSSLGTKLLTLVAYRAHTDDSILSPYVRLLSSMAVGPSHHALLVHQHLRSPSTTQDWTFFFSNMENLARQLAPSLHSHCDGITVSSGGSHPVSGSNATNSNQPNDVALTPRVVDLLLSLCTVVQCVAIHPQVNSALLSPDLRMWDSLLSLLACPPAPPMLKGALFKALAATISGSGDSSQYLAANMWQHIQSSRMLVGLKQELDTVEAMARIYPETDGFLCLLERLTLFHVPYNTELIGSVVEFLVSDVVLKAQGRDYAQQGERWRMTGRALSALHTLLRRYQLPGCGDSWEELGLVGDGITDARQFHIDFGKNIPRAYQATTGGVVSQVQAHQQHWGSVDRQETTSLQQEGQQEIQQWGEGARRTAQYGSASTKSPGYNILLHIVSGGPLFRAVAGIISEAEGCLAESRDSAVRREIVASLHSFSSALDEDTYMNCGEDPNTILFASRDASKEDWSWWHERSVCLCLSLLLVASEKESCFRDQLRTCMVTAPYSTSSPLSVSASATLGDLLADDTFFRPIPAIARFVDYPPSILISLLSSRLILRLSRNLAPQRMLSALQVGEGMDTNAIRPFVRRFSSVVKKFTKTGQNSAFSGLCCLSGTCDPVLWSVPSSLLLSWPQDNAKTVCSSSVVARSGFNATTSHTLGQEGRNAYDGSGGGREEDDVGGIGEEKAAGTLSLLLCEVILDILLVSVSFRGPSLSLVFLFGSEATPNCLSGASDVVLDLNNHPDTKKQPRCIPLVLDLLLFPPNHKNSGLESCNPVITERSLHLVCDLLSNPVTSSATSTVLACARFFQGMPRRAFEATAEPNPPAKLHAVAWLLRSIALSLYLSYKVHTLPSRVLDMTKGLFAELFDGDDTGSLPLLELISALPVCGPPPDAPGSGLRLSEVLREATVPLSGPQDICRGFNLVDVPRLRLLLSDTTSWVEGSASASSNDALIWAMEYNAYVERLASLRHLTTSCAQMVEVIVIGCSSMVTPEGVRLDEREGQFNANGGLRSSSLFCVGQKEWGWRSMYHVLGRLLGKISDSSTDATSLLLEPLAHACVTTMGSLQDMGLEGLPTVVEGEKILGTILLAATSVGSGGSRQGSALLRSRLYTCLLMHLQMPRKATAPLLGEKGLPLVKAVQLEEKHDATIRSLLIDAIGSSPLITILQRDADEGTPMLRSISLAVLSETFYLLNGGSDISELARHTALSTLSSKDFLHQAVALVGKVLCGQIRSTTAAETSKTDGAFLQTGNGGHIHSSVLDSACALLLQVSGSEEGARALMDSGLVIWLSEGEEEREKANISFTQLVHEDGRGRDGGKPYSLLYPALQLVLALLTALPRNEKLVMQVIGFVQKNAKSLLCVLRLQVASLDALRAAGIVICILSHLIKSPFENAFTNSVGKYADKLSAAAVSLFVILARSPYPNLSASSRTAETATNSGYDTVHHKVTTTWWSVKPMSTDEEMHCTILAPPPPGMVLHGGSEWTLFDADRLEEGARVMCHAATFLRLRSSYSPQQSIDILSLADCIVACHKVYRLTNSESNTDDSTSGSGRYGYLRASTLHVLECLVATAQACCSSLHGGGSHEELAILTPPLDSLARDSDKHPFLKLAVRKTVDALQS